MRDKIIGVENLSKSFGEKKVLNSVSFDVIEGENLIVFGRSGTGKSVLLKSIVKLLVPDEGKIFFEGKNIFEMREKELLKTRKQIGFLFQSGALYDSMSVRENLAFPLRKLTDMKKDEINAKIVETLRLVSLEEAIDKMPAELSGGMRKRIGLARTIITEPRVILYDEPTTGLDPITAKEISQLILNLQRKLKTTSVVVTHDLICAEIIADRVIFLKEGEIYLEGKLDDIKESNDRFIQNFFSNKILIENGVNDA
jgi:phospholipid/cholesterol/gamma-HCH transport system ATP-binding protein